MQLPAPVPKGLDRRGTRRCVALERGYRYGVSKFFPGGPSTVLVGSGDRASGAPTPAAIAVARRARAENKKTLRETSFS